MEINSIDHIDIHKRPKRIVSLVPSITELLVDLNLEDELLGITKFCTYPRHLKKTKTIVGGTKEVHIDKIKTLQPDLIICNKEENTKEIVMEAEKIAPVFVCDLKEVDENPSLFLSIGKLTHRNFEARNLVDKFNFARDQFEQFIKTEPERSVAYFIWAKPWMVAGSQTYINSVLKLNHFKNVYANLERYPVVEIKKFRMQGDADYVLFPDEPFPFKDEHAFELGRFTHHAKTVFIDGSYFSWYGSRSIKAFKYFKEVIKSL
ncbi:helical backbone metal receptor [Flavobacteriaceae bacterium]|nr:helical backbone metal receptor [Flavobacteriaceae bacterium]